MKLFLYNYTGPVIFNDDGVWCLQRLSYEQKAINKAYFQQAQKGF